MRTELNPSTSFRRLDKRGETQQENPRKMEKLIEGETHARIFLVKAPKVAHL